MVVRFDVPGQAAVITVAMRARMVVINVPIQVECENETIGTSVVGIYMTSEITGLCWTAFTRMPLPVVLVQIGVILVAAGMRIADVKVQSVLFGIRTLAPMKNLDMLRQGFPLIAILVTIRADVVESDVLRPMALHLSALASPVASLVVRCAVFRCYQGLAAETPV